MLPKTLFYLFLVLFSFSNAIAKSSNKVTVLAEQLQPYQYLDQQQAKGVAVELINQLLARAELEPEVKFYPWARVMRLAQTARNSIILSITRTPEREHDYHWIGKIASHELQLLVNKDTWQQQKVDQQLINSLTIGVPRGSHQHQYLLNLAKLKQSHIATLNTKKQSLEMLLKGRIDAVPGNQKLLSYRMKKMGLASDKLLPILTLKESYSELYIAMGKNSDPKLVQALQLHYEEFANTEQFKQLTQW